MTDPSAPLSARRRASLSTLQSAGVAGLAFAILLSISLVLLGGDPPRVAAQFPAWWEHYQPRVFIALYLIPFAGIAFLWLLAALRRRIGRNEDQFFATVLLGSGLLFVAMLFAAGAIASAAVAVADSIGEDAYETFVFGRAVARTLFWVFGLKMAAAFMLVASTIARRTGVLPRWFAIVGIVAGILLLLVVTFTDAVAFVFPAWVAILGVILIRVPAGGAPAATDPE